MSIFINCIHMRYCKQIPYFRSNPIRIIKSLPTHTPNLVAITNGTLPTFMSHHSNANLLRTLNAHKPVWVYGLPGDSFDQALLLNAAKNEAKSYLELGSQAISALLSRDISNVHIVNTHPSNSGMLKPFIQGAMLSNYSFEYKTQKTDKNKVAEVECMEMLLPSTEKESDLQRMIASSSYCLYCRNLANQIGSVATTEWMETQACLLESKKLEMEVIKGEELLSHNMNLLYSVGHASKFPPRMVNLLYKGNPNSSDLYALIGKGVVYDTGGLNLKPTNSIEDMFLDKSGACTVLALMKAISEQNLPFNVVGSLALAENAISEASYKPGDILIGHKGITVEVGNTDAEGRLCLADCMSYVQQKYKPTHMIDFATLTGACVAALGTRTAGLFSNDKQLSDDILKSGLSVFESMWQMPILDEHRTNVKGKKADLSNVSTGTKFGGACNAAAFLEKFVDSNVKWCHIDIAGYDYNIGQQ